MLRLYGQLAEHGDSVVVPFLLPDAPVVAWWPGTPPGPARRRTRSGGMAQRRITDAAATRKPVQTLEQCAPRARARATPTWPGAASRCGAGCSRRRSTSRRTSPSTAAHRHGRQSTARAPSCMAAWLALTLRCPVSRTRTPAGSGLISVVLERESGPVELVRPEGNVATLTQPGQPDRRVSLPPRADRDCLAEELRRLDPDEIYAEVLTEGLKLFHETGDDEAGARGVRPAGPPSGRVPDAPVAGGERRAGAAPRRRPRATAGVVSRSRRERARHGRRPRRRRPARGGRRGAAGHAGRRRPGRAGARPRRAHRRRRRHRDPEGAGRDARPGTPSTGQRSTCGGATSGSCPEGHPDRNETQAREALLDHVPVDPARVHPMPATGRCLGRGRRGGRRRATPRSCARAAGPRTGAACRPSTCCCSGVGPDGHVASLFPEHPALHETERTVVGVRGAPKPPPVRISLTMPVIRTASEVWLLAAGAEKAAAVALALSGAGEVAVPAAGAAGTRATLWLLDRASAARVPAGLTRISSP